MFLRESTTQQKINIQRHTIGIKYYLKGEMISMDTINTVSLICSARRCKAKLPFRFNEEAENMTRQLSAPWVNSLFYSLPMLTETPSNNQTTSTNPYYMPCLDLQPYSQS